ncbi:MAG: hypothetical protein AABX05_02780 [Nanoarchaeota archaeon]
MYQKRGCRSTCQGKKAQITVFMILGLLILFVFVFIFSLSKSIKTGQLEDIKENVLTKSFKKEALRIFVEACLTDQLETGSKLIGGQGRLWNDQPGGTVQFQEGVSGITIGDDRVFYAINNETYLDHSNA